MQPHDAKASGSVCLPAFELMTYLHQAIDVMQQQHQAFEVMEHLNPAFDFTGIPAHAAPGFSKLRQTAPGFQ